ncbi:MAG: Bor family protein [Gemmatimonadetes bacterium]|nr:Bor family protein [Gemmatimonadota bacterium]
MNAIRFARTLAAASIVAAVFATTACYHAVIETGRQPSGQSIKQPWAMSFVYGLVPPPVVEAASKCPNGAAKVETQHSFLNSLVGGITFGIVTPMTIQVDCAASGSRAGMADAAAVIDADGASSADLEKIFNEAIRTAQTEDAPVYVRF